MNEAHIILGLAAMLGGFIRGFSGFGGPMTIIPVLSLYYPPALSIWIMAIVDLAANVYLVPTAKQHATAKIYVPLVIGSLLSLALGVYLLVLVNAAIMQRAILVAIILSCGLLMSGWVFRGRMGTSSWTVVGTASGLVLGATLIAVVTSVFLNAASKDSQENRANFIIWACITGVAVVILLSRQDVTIAEHVPILALLIPTYFVSCIAGTRAQARFKGPLVRQITLVLIMVVAGTSLAASYNVFG